ncbi:MAG TPA: fumarylacetoacetate hydrolase family protein [Symbiobacteriaceae bacterium]|nr:fumarylacetoacetate hydrolase family protein [Symbiobacteriaceae bacterium]
MQYLRVAHPNGIDWATSTDGAVELLSGAPWAGGQPTGARFAFGEVRLLAPVQPSKLICIGRNYAEHAAELGNQAPTEPMFFLKAPSALIGPDEAIELPYPEHQNHWEAELAVVIGRRAKRVTESEALDYVFGYTAACDISDRDIQKADAPFGFGRAKSFDTFCPCGPAITPASQVDPSDLRITLTCNGETRQDDSTALMIHNVPKLISFLSGIMTLEPGDLILTGTPKGVGAMHPGDELAITIAGIGTLRNTVREGTPNR